MPTITVETVPDGLCPSTGITVQGLALTEQLITVWRTQGRDRTPVRGAQRVSVVDSFYVRDWEVPLMRDVTYTLEILTGDGAGVLGISTTVLVESDSGFLQDPLDPSTAVPVHAARGTHGEAYLRSAAFTQLAYDANVSYFNIMGSRLPVAIGGTRQAPSGVPFHLSTTAAEENLRLRELVVGCVSLVVRPLPEWGDYLPSSATYSAESVVELPQDVTYGGTLTHWQIPGTQVRPSSARVVVSLFSYQDVEELYLTYDDKQSVVDGRSYLEDQKQPAGAPDEDN